MVSDLSRQSRNKATDPPEEPMESTDASAPDSSVDGSNIPMQPEGSAADSGGPSEPPPKPSEPPPKPPEPPPEPPPKPLDTRALQIDRPFSIAPSAASSQVLASWMEPIAAIGVQWMRNFAGQDGLAVAKSHQVEVSGTLMWSSASPQTFPVNDLPGWRAYVRSLVESHKGQVKYWEVWNEPPNFSTNKSPSDYAKIVVAAYEEVKAIDNSMQVGLATHSNNVSFLDQALVAGAAGHFDYVTVHPYELLDLLDLGWEPTFMRVVPTLRRMLAARDPARMNVPIWFTEIGQAVTMPVTPAQQADSVIKAYTLGFAQGVSRIAWFEGIDGDAGPFGLIAANGDKRPAYTALKTLIAQLGPNPRYFGWVLLNSKHYGFVFEGPRANLLITWGRPATNEMLMFDTPVQVITPATGAGTDTSMVTLTASPVIVSGIGPKLVDQAVANRATAFPWSGEMPVMGAASFAAPELASGVHPNGRIPVTMVAGEPALDLSSRTMVGFAVDPNFLSYDRVPIQITAVLRKVGTSDAGFNLKYESTTGLKGGTAWYTVPTGDQWTTVTWPLTDSLFVGMWGYNFSFDSDSTEHSQYLLKSVSVSKQ